MYYQTKKNKFNAKSSVYNGTYYHSQAEAGYAKTLDTLIKGGKVIKWERQIPIDLIVNDIKICRYYCDFKVWWTDGRITLEEVKGYETDIYRFKRRLLEAVYLKEHPELEYIIIKV